MLYKANGLFKTCWIMQTNAFSSLHLELDMQPQQVITKDKIGQKSSIVTFCVCMWADEKWAGSDECCFIAC